MRQHPAGPPGPTRLWPLWVAAWLLTATLPAADLPATPGLAAGELRDWDAITTRAEAAGGRADDFFQQLLGIALRQVGRPQAEVALGVAEHLTRADELAIDYTAAVQLLARFDSADDGGSRPQDRLGVAGWYLLERLRARCYYRAGRIVDAHETAKDLQNRELADAWWVVGPFGRHLEWAFDTAYPPESSGLNAGVLTYAGADYHWHPLPLSAETGGLNPAAALEPVQGVGYARSTQFHLLGAGETAETVQLLVWSTGPWKLQVVGENPAGATVLSRDPGVGNGADLQLYELPLLKNRSYRVLVKLPAGTTDFNVLILDPATRRPQRNLNSGPGIRPGDNPAVRELPLVGDLLSAVGRGATAAGSAAPDRTAQTAGDSLRTGVAAYSVGAYGQARYYLRPVAHQSAATEYWFALSYLDPVSELRPGLVEEPLALLYGAARRDPGNLEIQARLIELLAAAGNLAEARARLQGLCAREPVSPELACLHARFDLAWSPAAEIEPWLERLPDHDPGPRLGPAGEPPRGDPGTRSKFYRLKRQLRLQLLRRDRRYADALACLQEIIADYGRGHARHCLFNPHDRNWPPGLYCPPAVIAEAAGLYRLAGQAATGYRELFGPEIDPSGQIAKISAPELAECLWQLRAAMAGESPTPEMRAREEETWQRLLAVNTDAPRLWRLRGDRLAAEQPPGNFGEAYATSFQLDNRQLELLRYLPHFSERFAGAMTVPPPNLQAAAADANPALPALAGRSRRRVVYLSYLPQGDCLETCVEECRVTRTAAEPVAYQPTDLARELPGRVRALEAWLETAPAPGQVRREALTVGLSMPGTAGTPGAASVVALGLPVPAGTGERTTSVWRTVRRRMLPADEPEYPAPVDLSGGELPGTADEAVRIFAAVPMNLAAQIEPLPLPAASRLPAGQLQHTEQPSDYGPLGSGGRLHEWRLNLPPPAAPEPDAPPPARAAIHFVLGRALTTAEIARAHQLGDRYRSGITREIQEEADRIKRTAGVGNQRLLERLRQAVIEYVPVDRPTLATPADSVLCTGIGSRATLYLALARALQLPGLAVLPCYPYPNPVTPPADDRQATELQPARLAGTKETPRTMIAVVDAGGEPRILDLADHAPGDGPGIWLPATGAPAPSLAPAGRATRTQAPVLYRGGVAVIAGRPAGPGVEAIAPRLWTLPTALEEADGKADKNDAGPMYDLFEIQLAVDGAGKAELAVGGSWSGPAAQQMLLKAVRPPRREFDSEVIWKTMLGDFPLSARLPGAALRVPGWYLLNPATQPQDLSLSRLIGSEPADLVGGPAYNTFTIEFTLDGTAYATPQADGQLRCYLPLRRLQLVSRWAALNERRQPLQFNEWRLAREFVQVRAAGRKVIDTAPPPLHYEFLPLIVYDLEITSGNRQRWDATRTLRMQPGVVAPEDYPRFKRVLEQIAAADQTTVAFGRAP